MRGGGAETGSAGNRVGGRDSHRHRSQRPLVAEEAQVPDLGRGHQLEHRVDHPEAGPEDRHEPDPLAELRRLDWTSWKGVRIPPGHGAPGRQLLTLPELLGTVSTAVWTEIDKPAAGPFTDRKPMITSLRRALQREHLERLVDLSGNRVVAGPGSPLRCPP